MDIQMPIQDGISATAQIAAAGHARVLILTTFHLDENVISALRSGASGFLLKDVDAGRLLEAIRVVHAGDAIVDPAVTRRLLDRFVHRLPAGAGGADLDGTASGRLAGVTERETEVPAHWQTQCWAS
jgi:DNA-binding NarL/FixJ family response regulator